MVDALTRAGLSWETAVAMERQKAEEILQLLRGGEPDHAEERFRS